MSETPIERIRKRIIFNENWSVGAEPAAAIPNEPIEFYKADINLENAEATLMFTEDGKYYIILSDGRYVRNPKTNSTIFNTAYEAKNEFYKSIKVKR